MDELWRSRTCYDTTGLRVIGTAGRIGKDGLVPIRTGGMGWEGFRRVGTGWYGLEQVGMDLMGKDLMGKVKTCWDWLGHFFHSFEKED